MYYVYFFLYSVILVCFLLSFVIDFFLLGNLFHKKKDGNPSISLFT